MTGLEDAFERIGAAAEQHLPLSHAPGLALSVTDADATFGAVVRGFADAAAGRPVRPDTRFQIGSISKSFASLCVLQEEAKGALALDVSVNELLPWLELPEPFGPITLHHLLTHTSGLMTGVEHGPWGMADALRARAYPATFPPGERFSYSNLGYKLVGHVLERVTGTPVHRLLLERILGPLGMTRSVGAILEEDRADAAVGYEPLLSDRPPHLESRLAPAVWQVANTADGSVVSTVADLCAYARMVLARGGELLDETAFDRWVGPYADTEERGTRYGYGWDVLEVEGRRLIRHTGGTVGFTALLEIWPDDDLAVTICQNGDGSRDLLARVAREQILAALRDEPAPPIAPPRPPEAIDDAGALAGTYTSDDRAIELAAEEGGLTLHAGPLAVRLEVRPDETDIFAVPHAALETHLLRVVRGPSGDVIAVTHGPAWYAREGAARSAAPPSPEPAWLSYPGLYRADAPWAPAFRIYMRRGGLWLTTGTHGEEFELTPLPRGWFAVGDPALPRRCRFSDVVEGLAQTLDYNGEVLSRSFEG